MHPITSTLFSISIPPYCKELKRKKRTSSYLCNGVIYTISYPHQKFPNQSTKTPSLPKNKLHINNTIIIINRIIIRIKQYQSPTFSPRLSPFPHSPHIHTPRPYIRFISSYLHCTLPHSHLTKSFFPYGPSITTVRKGLNTKKFFFYIPRII